jgi:PTH1 family peptidyl-tRNA hydrolase
MLEKKIKLIIGLGNEGEKYQKTYHNAGWLFVGFWNKVFNQNNPPPQSSPLLTQEGGKFIEAVKTEGFMNQSGNSVKKILKEKGLKIEEALIAHDDSDIYLGEYKISRNRGAAGHKGVEHIMAVFGTKDFARLRIGIRPPEKSFQSSTLIPPLKKGEGEPRMKADEFVLKNITPANMKKLEGVFEEAAKKLLW